MQKQIIFLAFIFLATFLVLEISAQDSFIEIPVEDNFTEPWSIFPVNMDGDDDIDIVSSARLDNKIAWWERNENGEYIYHEISDNSFYVMGIIAFDIDNDNDIDIIAASQTNGLELWKNNGNQQFFLEIIGNWNCPTYVDSADVNKDGRVDILVACCENNSNKIGWVENQEGLNFVSHEVMTNWSQANSIDAGDIDNDGDIDLVGTASGREVGHGEIILFYNDGNQYFTPDTLYSTIYRPSFGIIRDLDKDGDNDIVAAVCQINSAIWFENIENEFGEYQIIGTGLNRGLAIEVADLDNDNDLDVISGSINLSKLYWFENNQMDFTRHTITSTYDGAADVYPCDMDQDGDIDILSTAQYDNKISIWDNQFIATNSDYNELIPSSKNSLSCYPNPFSLKNQRKSDITFEYELRDPSFIKLEIFNIKGQLLETLFNQKQKSGIHTLNWIIPQNISSGIYYCKLSSVFDQITCKFVILE